jgi:hypothetical protein
LANPSQIQGFLSGGTSASPQQDQVLAIMVATAPARVRTVVAAAQAGGSAQCIIDLRINGTSAYTDPAHRPTLPAGQSGRFTSYLPDRSAVRIGDIVTLVVAAGGVGTPATVAATAALEEPS